MEHLKIQIPEVYLQVPLITKTKSGTCVSDTLKTLNYELVK